jgi:septum formation protein
MAIIYKIILTTNQNSLNKQTMMNIILASSSTYRKQLLAKVIAHFHCVSPNIDETQQKNETFTNLAKRLAVEKAKAIAEKHPNSLIIGSDQVACLGSKQLHKPQTREKTIEQLMACQGKSAYFHTSLCLLNSKTNKIQTSVEHYETKFRNLSEQQISHYVDREPAFDCAGGFKMEGLGISLFEKISGDDPNILIGLPLIKLIQMLENEGVFVL